MPVKRRLAKGKQHRITPDAVELFRLGEFILAEGSEDKWEEDGGRQREFNNTWVALHTALGLHPHETSPLDVDDGPPPPCWGEGYDAGTITWPQAQELRKELEALL